MDTYIVRDDRLREVLSASTPEIIILSVVSIEAESIAIGLMDSEAVGNVYIDSSLSPSTVAVTAISQLLRDYSSKYTEISFHKMKQRLGIEPELNEHRPRML